MVKTCPYCKKEHEVRGKLFGFHAYECPDIPLEIILFQNDDGKEVARISGLGPSIVKPIQEQSNRLCY